jgi:cytoskeletal protein RodZ
MSLEALERSDLSRLPGGIFTRAFIRAYAQEVGLDPDRTIQDFIAELPSDAATATTRAAGEDSEKFESDRRAVTTAIRLVLFSAPILGLMAYFGAQQIPAEEQTGRSAPAIERSAAAPAMVLPGEPPPVVTDAPETQAEPVTQASDLTLEIAPRASCWVSVTADGDQTFSVLMNAGDKRIVSAKEQILINVGDAGAFGYSLNGQPGRPLGAPGEVVSKRITLTNLDEFVAP